MKTFRMGGVHLNDYKFSAGRKAQISTLPKQVYIPLGHYAGASSIAIVGAGDEVKTGQLIGKANGFISANVHSSVSGKVIGIDHIMDASGTKHPAVCIDVDGDEWIETIDRTPEIVRNSELSAEEIIKKIADAGIVGLGGATFPTHVKLTLPPGKKADTLIINGVECEPYLTCDHQLMLEKGEEILVGVTLLMKAIQVKQAFIGIENNKKDAIANLRHLAKTFTGIRIIPLKVKYPQGGEKQLIEATLGRKVPSGALPVEVGVVVQNVATTFAVYEAVQKNKPLIERMITITGKAMTTQGNWWTRLGVPLAHVVHQAGGIPKDTGKIIAGGPMMGRAISVLDIPTAKGSAGVLFIPGAEATRKEMQNCIRCARCVSDCPMGLEPYLLMTQNEKEMWTGMENNRVMDCIECGCCSFICPSNRPLLDHIRLGKSKVGSIIRERNTKK